MPLFTVLSFHTPKSAENLKIFSINSWKSTQSHVLHQTDVPTSDHWRILQHTFHCFRTKTRHEAGRMKSFRKGHVMCQMCCNLELKTLNNRKTTALLRNHRKRHVCSDSYICTTQQYSVFSAKFCTKSEEYFPQSFGIVVTYDVPTSYLIFCTKHKEAVSFYRQHPVRHVTFPEWLHSPSCMACLCSETSKGVL